VADKETNGAVAVANRAPEKAPVRPPMGVFDQMEREFAEMRRRMATVFRHPAAPFYGPAMLPEVNWAPTVDAYEQDGALVVKAELPGVKQENVSIAIERGILTIEGDRSEEKETKEARYYASERFSGTFTRSFTLPDGVDTAAITATYKDGLLEVRVPLPKARRAEAVKVPIQT